MLTTLFGKKKLTEDKTANIFVNTLTSVVDNTFEEVRDSIINDPVFERPPSIKEDDSDRLMMIVLASNLKMLSKYFSASEEMLLKGKIIHKFSLVYGLEYDQMKTIASNYSDFCSRVNHPSKNIVYGMSKAVFFKYKLGQYQDDYFAQLNAPNPIFLKRMDSIMENYIWDWNSFFNKYKLSPSEG
ncbi:MAG: hypothetical protein ACJ0QL_03975 [Parvicellaceae bacterium]